MKQLISDKPENKTAQTFHVYGHTDKGKPIIVTVFADNGAHALDLARSQRPDCKFNHTQIA